VGLGKTVQVSALLAAILEKKGLEQDKIDLRRGRIIGMSARSRGRGVIIVMPASVVKNWERELKKWGHFSIRILDSKSLDEAREAVADDLASGKVEVILVNHNMLEKMVSFLIKPSSHDNHPRRYAALVVDECHEFKNPGIQRYECMKSLVEVSDFRIGLTGTPMSNNYKELFSLLDLFSPGTCGRFDNHNAKHKF
jgi:SNF2 family DNA or RNA helicase